MKKVVFGVKNHKDAKSLFTERVRDVVRHIPKGKIMTYKEVAEKAGSPNAARAVGSIMKHNYLPDVPCHRVIRSDGNAGEYNRGGEEQKRIILQEEGFLQKHENKK